MKTTIREFLKLESAGGIMLVLAAVPAMMVANSPLQHWYAQLLDVPVEIRVGALYIAKPLILWINDGLMAVFFFLVGLELKREFLEGELSRPSNILLSALGAVGGVAVPVSIYLLLNHDNVTAMNGWAIPAATDIAFALGILMLFGKRVPTSLKVFLVSVAIFDDLAAILIIAFFYTSEVSGLAMLIASACIAVLASMAWRGVSSISPYLWVGMIMWVAVLKSGVHATLAGVVLASFIPMRVKGKPNHSPLRELEDDLHYPVAFLVLPVFAFANSGVSLQGVGIAQLLHPVPLGIAAGLFFGKQLGVFLFCWLSIRLGIASMPRGANWASLYGVAVLCGVGFTVSLFVGSLAFEVSGTDMHTVFDERLGVIAGSLGSGLLGYLVLRRALPKSPALD